MWAGVPSGGRQVHEGRVLCTKESLAGATEVPTEERGGGNLGAARVRPRDERKSRERKRSRRYPSDIRLRSESPMDASGTGVPGSPRGMCSEHTRVLGRSYHSVLSTEGGACVESESLLDHAAHQGGGQRRLRGTGEEDQGWADQRAVGAAPSPGGTARMEGRTEWWQQVRFVKVSLCWALGCESLQPAGR